MYGTLARQKDEQLLMALHLVENMGLSHSKTAAIVGMTKNACIGAISRVRNEPTGVHSIIRNPDNKDGSQKPLWWFDPSTEFAAKVFSNIPKNLGIQS